ncbi:hypothetical protein F5148DRAFT_1151909 [Russula earlei]|uniref:Uncharacterized protein n=1 Tax=Russula earlei TaxID=71964 RepID=A0ACC0U0R5_9AGAM|nr:hypothetical protein F5148DRAFT_1151909 [Russula earlei]
MVATGTDDETKRAAGEEMAEGPAADETKMADVHGAETVALVGDTEGMGAGLAETGATVGMVTGGATEGAGVIATAVGMDMMVEVGVMELCGAVTVAVQRVLRWLLQRGGRTEGSRAIFFIVHGLS